MFSCNSSYSRPKKNRSRLPAEIEFTIFVLINTNNFFYIVYNCPVSYITVRNKYQKITISVFFNKYFLFVIHYLIRTFFSFSVLHHHYDVIIQQATKEVPRDFNRSGITVINRRTRGLLYRCVISIIDVGVYKFNHFASDKEHFILLRWLLQNGQHKDGGLIRVSSTIIQSEESKPHISIL